MDYQETGAFSRLVNDFVSDAEILRPFQSFRPDAVGFRRAVEVRSTVPVDRDAMGAAIRETHASRPLSEKQAKHLDALESEGTFTVCTAHQPNIFTGYLYFVYKILHTIRLADELSKEMPEHRFVPVFFMGSEDNDLDELGQFRLHDLKLTWLTGQQGAVGRMKVDAGLTDLIRSIAGAYGHLPHGVALVEALEDAYQKGVSIAEATFRFVNHLFASQGLLILQADRPSLKRQMIPVFREELLNGTSQPLVESAIAGLEQGDYKIQVHPREINLFYLTDGLRNRIVRSGDGFSVDGSELQFSREEMLATLEAYPERFSPNVILRGLYQETIMPNIAFIGGGSEVAYWMELKGLFAHFDVPFPVLVLRNSFLLLDKSHAERVLASGWNIESLFRPVPDLMNEYVRRVSEHRTDISPEIAEISSVYKRLTDLASAIDPTLCAHVEALEKKSADRLNALSAKLFRAEKRKYSEMQRRLESLKSALFPGGLQERYENILLYYATYGPGIIDVIFEHSQAWDMRFGIIRL
jgi:bacillithiol biosynthesis cysteine-adding enzyme BshC